MMKQRNSKLRGVSLAGLLVVSSNQQADAFTTGGLQHTSSRSSKHPRLFEPTKPLVVASHAESSAVKLNLFNKDDDNCKEEVGGMAANVGRQAWKLIKQGGSKLKDLAVKGATSLGKALFSSSEAQEEAMKQRVTTSRPPIVVDTEDEDLFRSILQDEDGLSDAFVAANEADRLVDEAAMLLDENDMAAAVLGDSIQHSFPISHSRQTRKVAGGGKTTTDTVEATFEVWGLKGKGLATVVAVDGTITSLELLVDGQVYPIDPTATTTTTTTSGIPKTSSKTTQAPPKPWEPAEDVETVLEVEVLEGVRRLNPPKDGRIIDAEILDKKITL